MKSVPANLVNRCEELRLELLEKIAEFDDDLMMKILEGEEPSIEEIKSAIRKVLFLAPSSLSSVARPIKIRAFNPYWMRLSIPTFS